VLAFISCKKNNGDTINANTFKPIDSVVGRYDCNIHEHSEHSNGAPPITWDSTYSGIMTVTKLNDSTINVSVDNYPISHGTFKYTKALEQHSAGDPHDSFTTFYYFPSSDSATIGVSTYGGGSGGYSSYGAFIQGKKKY
jgi:hypothetical protein